MKCLILFLSLILAIHVSAAREQIQVISYYFHPPFKTEHAGLNHELLEYLKRKVPGVNFQLVTGSKQRALRFINLNQPIIIPFVDANSNFGLSKKTKWTRPVFKEDIFLISKDKVFENFDQDELLKYTYANLVNHTYYIDHHQFTNTRSIKCETIKHCFNLVAKGRADFTFASKQALSSIGNKELNKLKIKISKEAFYKYIGKNIFYNLEEEKFKRVVTVLNQMHTDEDWISITKKYK